MTLPDTAKTQQVDAILLLDGDAVERVTVALNPSKHAGETWIVTVHYGWAQTNVALCDYPHHAAAVAYALSGCMDCDLELGDDLEAALTRNTQV